MQLRYVRGYPHPNAAHALGYLREVNQEEIDESILRYKQDIEEEVFAAGDYIGASGLEASYDKELRGKKGYKIYSTRQSRKRSRCISRWQHGFDEQGRVWERLNYEHRPVLAAILRRITKKQKRRNNSY
ncbi:MAG: hypothetical protein HC892_20000 [Saprospiraceae bacterium]|nr:hypothetical protein [Saprospiraceae bacterium]